jgi:TolB-like protein
VILISRGCSVSREAKGTITPESAAKLKAISNEYQGSLNKADIGKLGVEIAKAFDDEDTPASAHSPVLAIPFSGATADAAQSKLADSAFALVYGRLSIAHAGKVGLSKEPLGALDASAGADRGREHHSRYVVCGGITASGATAALTVDIVSVRDGTVAWTGSYPVAGTDPATIAADVDAHLPSLDDE